QNEWLKNVLEARGLKLAPQPWADVVASAGTASIDKAEYAQAMRRQLPLDDLREACYQLALAKRLGALAAAIPPAKIDAAVAKVVERRKADVEKDPRYKGVSFAQFLQAQGLNEASLPG